MYNVYKQPTLCTHTDVFNLPMFVCTETNVNLTSYGHLQIHLANFKNKSKNFKF